MSSYLPQGRAGRPLVSTPPRGDTERGCGRAPAARRRRHALGGQGLEYPCARLVEGVLRGRQGALADGVDELALQLLDERKRDALRVLLGGHDLGGSVRRGSALRRRHPRPHAAPRTKYTRLDESDVKLMACAELTSLIRCRGRALLAKSGAAKIWSIVCKNAAFVDPGLRVSMDATTTRSPARATAMNWMFVMRRQRFNWGRNGFTFPATTAGIPLTSCTAMD